MKNTNKIESNIIIITVKVGSKSLFECSTPIKNNENIEIAVNTKQVSSEINKESKEPNLMNQRDKVSKRKKKTYYTVTDLSKELGFKRPHDLNVTLSEMKIQYKKGRKWLLYSKYLKKGYTKTVRKNHYRISKEKYITVDLTVFTEKGRTWLFDLLRNQTVMNFIN